MSQRSHQEGLCDAGDFLDQGMMIGEDDDASDFKSSRLKGLCSCLTYG
jgi:hypothetical protein